MKFVLLMTLFLLIKGQIEGSDEYEELINEKVSEQYCNDVITNLVIQISLRLQDNQKGMIIISLK